MSESLRLSNESLLRDSASTRSWSVLTLLLLVTSACGAGGAGDGASGENGGEPAAAATGGNATSSTGGSSGAGDPDGGDPGATGSGGTTGSSGAANGGGTSAGASGGEPTSTGGSTGTGGSTAAPASYVGNWTGRIGSQGERGLSFTVDEAGALRDITLTGSSTACGGTGVVEAAKSGPVIVRDDGSFEVTLVGCGGSACYTDHVAGTLSGDGTAQGTVVRYGGCSILLCISVTSDGDGTPWRAATDCSERPLEGASAERFCDASGASHADATGAEPTTIDGITCSVSPPDTGTGGTSSGTGGTSATGGAGGASIGGTGGATGSEHLGEQCGDVGCPPDLPPEACACPAEFPECDLESSQFWGPSEACGGGQCVGDYGSTKHCSAPCNDDTDCENPTRDLRCVITCSVTPLVGTCWPADSSLWVSCE